MLTIASALLLALAQNGASTNARVELQATWKTPEVSVPTIRCADHDCVKIKITSGPLSGMDMEMTPSLKGHAWCLLSLAFNGERISTLVPNHTELAFSWSGNRLNVAMQTEKVRNANVMRIPFWKELNGDVLSIDFKKEE